MSITDFFIGQQVDWRTASYWGGDGAVISSVVVKLGKKRIKIRTNFPQKMKFGQPPRELFWVSPERLHPVAVVALELETKREEASET